MASSPSRIGALPPQPEIDHLLAQPQSRQPVPQPESVQTPSRATGRDWLADQALPANTPAIPGVTAPAAPEDGNTGRSGKSGPGMIGRIARVLGLNGTPEVQPKTPDNSALPTTEMLGGDAMPDKLELPAEVSDPDADIWEITGQEDDALSNAPPAEDTFKPSTDDVVVQELDAEPEDGPTPTGTPVVDEGSLEFLVAKTTAQNLAFENLKTLFQRVWEGETHLLPPLIGRLEFVARDDAQLTQEWLNHPGADNRVRPIPVRSLVADVRRKLDQFTLPEDGSITQEQLDDWRQRVKAISAVD